MRPSSPAAASADSGVDDQAHPEQDAAEQPAVEIVNRNSHIGMVVFGGLGMGFALPQFEFARTLSSLDVSVVYLRDLQSSWYTSGVPGLGQSLPSLSSGLDTLLQSLGMARACAIGNSSGGFAALSVAAKSDVIQDVLAFAPQSTLTRSWRQRWRDRRWPVKVARIHERLGPQEPQLDVANALRGSSPRAEVYFGALHRLDAQHALRLQRVPNLTLVPVLDRTHHPVRRLRDRGQLLPLIRRHLDEMA